MCIPWCYVGLLSGLLWVTGDRVYVYFIKDKYVYSNVLIFPITNISLCVSNNGIYYYILHLILYRSLFVTPLPSMLCFSQLWIPHYAYNGLTCNCMCPISFLAFDRISVTRGYNPTSGLYLRCQSKMNKIRSIQRVLQLLKCILLHIKILSPLHVHANVVYGCFLPVWEYFTSGI